MKKISCLLFLVIITTGYHNTVSAQTTFPEWVVASDTLSYLENGYMQEMSTDDLGNVYVFWSNGNNMTGDNNARLIKYNTLTASI